MSALDVLNSIVAEEASTDVATAIHDLIEKHPERTEVTLLTVDEYNHIDFDSELLGKLENFNLARRQEDRRVPFVLSEQALQVVLDIMLTNQNITFESAVKAMTDAFLSLDAEDDANSIAQLLGVNVEYIEACQLSESKKNTRHIQIDGSTGNIWSKLANMDFPAGSTTIISVTGGLISNMEELFRGSRFGEEAIVILNTQTDDFISCKGMFRDTILEHKVTIKLSFNVIGDNVCIVDFFDNAKVADDVSFIS